jgi:hypothetical protein
MAFAILSNTSVIIAFCYFYADWREGFLQLLLFTLLT